MHLTNRALIFGLIVPLFLVLLPAIVSAQGNVIELTGTKDNRFRTPGQKGDPVFKLKAGEVVSLFPEGTRSPDEGLLPGKPGIGMIVSMSKAPKLQFAG